MTGIDATSTVRRVRSGGNTGGAHHGAANKAGSDFSERHYDEIVPRVCPGRFTHVIAAVMNAADSRCRAAYVLAGI